MDNKWNRFFWGVILIIIGAYALAENFDLAPELSVSAWAILFAIVSIFAFITYFTSGIKNWPMLFPAVGTASIAAVIWLSEIDAAGSWLGSIVLLSISAPFWVAYLTDKKQNWWATIPGWALSAIGIMVLFENNISGETFGALVLLSIALPFFVVYFRNKENWWALIPAGVLSAIGILLLFENSLGGEMFGALVVFSIAIIFLVVYLRNKELWWALIPAGVLSAVSAIILMEASGMRDEIAAGIFVSLLGIIFLAVYIRWQENWWALIPGGVLVSAGITTGLTTFLSGPDSENILSGIMLAGIALTFLVLWLRRDQHGTDWAIYPAVGVGAFSVLALIFEEDQAWPFVLIAAGLWLLYRSFK